MHLEYDYLKKSEVLYILSAGNLLYIYIYILHLWVFLFFLSRSRACQISQTSFLTHRVYFSCLRSSVDLSFAGQKWCYEA